MDSDQILYYNGQSARAFEVRVLVFHDALHLRSAEDATLNESIPFTHTSINRIGNDVFLYLDNSGLRYLQYSVNHILASLLDSEVAKSRKRVHTFGNRHTLVLLAILIILAAGLYLAVVSVIPFLGMRLISVEQEIKIGDRLKELTLTEAGALNNKVDTASTLVMQQFARQLRLSDRYPIRITVVDNDLVNAYALPGGNIVVYKGILQKIKTPEALAALLAHESTHINERHSLRSMLRSTVNGIIISVVFGDASGISGAVISNAETLNRLRYSRSLETEADTKGMDLMLLNHVDITGMQELLQTLQEEEKLPGSLAFFSTHPLTKERAAAAEKYALSHPRKFGNRNDLQEVFGKLRKELRMWK